MTFVENSHPELLSPSKNYLRYLPEDQELSLHICVIGCDMHFLAHACEVLYTHAEVSWFPHVDMFINDGNSFDYILFSKETFEFIHSNTDIMHIIVERTAKDGHWVHGFPEDLGYEKLYDLNLRNGVITENADSNGICYVHKATMLRTVIDVFPKYKTVYVVCPQCIKTGGPELLHQFVYWINYYCGNAMIAYYVTDEKMRLCHPELAAYVAGHICRYDEIEDSAENAIIIPEGWPYLATEARKAVQYFWWLSVDNYCSCIQDTGKAYKVLEEIDRHTYLHMYQSEYAKDFLLKRGINEEKLIHLGDYINQAYLDQREIASKTKKEDIILYNPKKGKEFVDSLRSHAPDMCWKAIEKMTTEEVGELMRRAKIYIDFGNHPGKDRIPREAAMSGCIVITGKKGSAAYDEDVPIPAMFKIDEKGGEEIFGDVVSLIRDSLKHYVERTVLFESYRNRIIMEKEEFIDELKQIFFE
ncbi:MAG: hypothetical protein K5697_10985 [Lachnospiraceae bacterium]|nr:hypothetical protein [Lachnospiraceae bacterium]